MKMRVCKFWFFKTDRGVTMLEFALVLPLLLVLIIGIIDVARYFAYQAILNKGAESGLNFALKVPNLDVDLKEYNHGDVDYQRYEQARDLVARKAVDIPLRTFFSDSATPSIAQLEDFEYTDVDAGGTEKTLSEEVALIFPGETLTASDGTAITHKTLPTPPIAQTKEDLLKIHPVIVELRAQIQPLTPFMSPITLQARAMGFREEIPRGPLTGEFGETSDPVVANPPTPTPTPTPVPILPVPDQSQACTPNWGQCAGAFTNNKCPNLNAPPAPLSTNCTCTPCTSTADPGMEKLSL